MTTALQERDAMSGQYDTDTGIAFGIRMAGPDSPRKNRHYPRPVVEKAVREGKYEGIPAFVDHMDPSHPRPRKLEERIGTFHNARMGSDGAVYGDLHYNPAHRLAPFLEHEGKHSSGVAFSHDTRGSMHRDRAGREIVDSIDKVLSCDLVALPATNKNFYESEEIPMNTEPFSSPFAFLHEHEDPAAVAVRVQETRRRFTRPSTVDEVLAESAGAFQEEDAADYAYCPDPDDQSTWKLNISDARHTAMAAEALSDAGFRGNPVDIPEGERAAVKSRVRAAWKRFFPGRDESEMPQSIRESADNSATTGNDNDGDNDLQEAWSPQARAAAAASRKQKAAAALTAEAEAASTKANRTGTAEDHAAAAVANDRASYAHSNAMHEAEGIKLPYPKPTTEAHFAANRKAIAESPYNTEHPKDPAAFKRHLDAMNYHQVKGDEHAFKAEKMNPRKYRQARNGDEGDYRTRDTEQQAAKQESLDSDSLPEPAPFAPYIPPATAPLTQRIRRFVY